MSAIRWASVLAVTEADAPQGQPQFRILQESPGNRCRSCLPTALGHAGAEAASGLLSAKAERNEREHRVLAAHQH